MERLTKARQSLEGFLSGKEVTIITAEQQLHVKGGGEGHSAPFIVTEDVTDP